MNPDTKEVVNQKEDELQIHSPFGNSRWTLTAGEFEYGFSAPANSTEDIIKGLREFANLLEHTNDPKNQRTLEEAIQQTKSEKTEQLLTTLDSVFDKLIPKDSIFRKK
jgi:hypothetical protein